MSKRMSDLIDTYRAAVSQRVAFNSPEHHAAETAAREALLGHSQEVNVGWHPIETVPAKTLVLIWDGFDVCIAKFVGRDWVSFGCDGPAVQHQDDFGTTYQEPCTPTHWMPLPAPPSPQETEQ